MCVGMARASRGEKRAPRACAGCGPPVPPRPPRGETRCVCVCVFVRHTARRRLWGVGAACEEAAGKKGARTRCAGGPFRLRILVCVRAIAGLEEGARLGAKEMRVAAQPQVWRAGALPADENQATGLPEPGGRARSRRHASRPGPRAPRAGASAARRARAWSKREKGGRPKGTDSRGGAPDARRKPTLFKTTRRAQSPRRRACCKVFRLRRRGGTYPT